MPILIFILTLVSCHVSAAELTVMYTGSSNGKLMGCDCPNDPYGGLSERVTLIGDMRGKEDGPFLLLDAGNAVGLFGDYDLKAESVYRIMNLMKYDFAAAGRNEVYRGVDRILRAAKKASFPLVSASFVSPETGKPIFPPFMTKRVGDVAVAVTALCDSSTFTHVMEREYDFTLLQPEAALDGVIGAMQSAADFIVVLSQMSPERNKAFLERYPAIDLIVEASTNRMYDPPVTGHGGVIVSPGSSCSHVGVITLDKNSGAVTVKRSELVPLLNIPQDGRAEKITVHYYRERE